MNAKPTPTGRTVHRSLELACGEMKRRLHGLLEPKSKVAAEIHALRKLGKLVRGGLRLLGVPREDVEAMSAIGRLLGTPRDAVSRLTTWQRLDWEAGPHAGDPSVVAILALLEANAKAAARRPPREVVAWADARLRHAHAALKAIPTAEWPVRIAAGRGELLRRLAKRLKRLERGQPGPHQFHRARKALKGWLGALHHLGESPPEPVVALADVLGDVNDLHVLGVWLDGHGFSRAFAPVAWRAIDEKLARLEAAALVEAPAVRVLVEEA